MSKPTFSFHTDMEPMCPACDHDLTQPNTVHLTIRGGPEWEQGHIGKDGTIEDSEGNPSDDLGDNLILDTRDVVATCVKCGWEIEGHRDLGGVGPRIQRILERHIRFF